MKGKLKNEGRLEPWKVKTNPHREDDMDEKELQLLLDKRDQKLIDILTKNWVAIKNAIVEKLEMLCTLTDQDIKT